MKRLCFNCEKLVKVDEDYQYLHDATAWTSFGNYGSSVIDSFGPGYGPGYELFVCDQCIVKKQKLLHRYRVEDKKWVFIEKGLGGLEAKKTT